MPKKTSVGFKGKYGMSKRLNIILIAACVLMTVFGSVISSVMNAQSDLKENTVIKVNGETDKTLKAELSGFYPGCEKEYIIVLKGSLASESCVTLEFRNGENNGGLENYINVKITAGEITVEKPLKDLFDGNKIDFGSKVSEIKITYAMPENTGNEAQGTTAFFYIDVTAMTAEGGK